MTLQPGQTLGRYQILEPLGVGGMATVYKAYQPSLEREVALKVLRPGFAEDPEFFERFQSEARSIARLRHPNIVQIFDFEPLDGRYVLAMEFLEGGTLKDRVTALAAEGKRLPKEEIARILTEVSEALGYGHELGIVHRDVKPSNVMLTRRDRAVVTDFGIAKIMGGEGRTQTGVGIGTPEYMAPEQGTGGKVDQRADIYSLGVMAYEMLTGRVPFTADTPLAIVLAHVRDPLPLPSTIDPTVDAATERVLLKALAKDPADRFESAPDFAAALKAVLVPAPTAATVYPIDATAAVTGAAPAIPAPTATVAGIPRNLMIGAALVALLLAGGAAIALTRGAPAATPTPSAAVGSPGLGCAFPPCPPAGGQGGPGPQSNPGPAVALPSKGALIVQVDLTKTTAVFGTTAKNKATIESRGLRLDAAEQPLMGVHAPAPSEAAGYRDFLTELRFTGGDSAEPATLRIVLVGSAAVPGQPPANTYVSARFQSDRRLQIEIAHDQPSAGGARSLAQANMESAVPAPTVLVMRRGQQLAVFVNGQFAASATDPLAQVSGIDLALQPVFGPGSQEPIGINSVVIESWAIYGIGS